MQTWVYGTWYAANLLIFKPRNLQLCTGFAGLILGYCTLKNINFAAQS